MKLVTLLLLLFTSETSTATQTTIEIKAKRFEFAPNVVHLKKGEPVTITLTSTDHSHGLLMKPLQIDLDAAEGRPDSVTITPVQAGTFNAICDHYCGSGHGNMKLTFVVE